ncbi:MAG: hypothetical protein ACQR33_00505 [Candidatus Saccharibacteria bacterium]
MQPENPQQNSDQQPPYSQPYQPQPTVAQPPVQPMQTPVAQPPAQPQPMAPVPSEPITPSGQPVVIGGGQPPLQPQTFTAASQQKPHKKFRWLKRIALGFLGLVILGLLAFAWHVYVPKLLKIKTNSAENKQLTSLAKGSTLTNASLAKLNKTDLFFGVFKHAAEQKVVTTKNAYYFSSKPHDYQTAGDMDVTSMDYGTKQYSYDSTQANADGFGPTFNRCIGAQQYYFDGFYPDLGWQKSDDSRDCSLESVGTFHANDGLNTGGLTSTQADTFVSSLRLVKNLVKVNSATLATHDGKQYIRFDVTINAVKMGDGYYGMQNFMWSFKDTGLDPSTQPYSYLGAVSDGAHLAYYVDPSTQLPAYTQLNTTGQIESNGKVWSQATYDYRHVEYSFGGQVPTLDLNSTNPITLSWPTDKL